VHCQWMMRGILNRNKESKVQSDGRTYDSKLYTFKEIDYRTVWFDLDIVIQKLQDDNKWGNVSSLRGKADIGEKILDSQGQEIDYGMQQDNMAPDFSDQNDVIPLILHSPDKRASNR
jgi:hypothetical protein